MADRIMFRAQREELVRWNVVVGGQEVEISEKEMEELVRRFLYSRGLKAVDKEGNTVVLKGITG
jgi:uncharacterized membrane protein